MFDVDTDRTLIAAADLVNTSAGLRSATPSPDQLTTVTQLREYLSPRDPMMRWPESGADRGQLERTRNLREKVHQIWGATPIDSDVPVQVLNELLDGVGLKVGLDSTGQYRAEPVPASRELADVMTANIATAIQQLVVRHETARMRTCKGESCDAVIIDLTRNRSRLFCDFGNCANRAHVRAYRARQAVHRKTFPMAPEVAAQSHRHSPRPDVLDDPRLIKPSAAEKAAEIEAPTSQSATAAKEFRDRMRDELMEKREKKSAKKLKKGKVKTPK